jgi:predicted Zn-dependent protease
MKNVLIFVIVILILLIGCKNKETEKSIIKIQESVFVFDTTGISLSYIEHLHERKTLKTYDKSLIDYINSNPNKPDSIRKVIYIIPFGNMKPEVEEIIKNEVEYLEAFLQLPVKVLERVSYDDIKKINSIKTRLVPDSDYGYYSKMKGGIEPLREQIDASSFMDNYLVQNKPEDAIAVLGITEHDIYSSQYNYLFGSSKLNDGVGLISTFRLIDYGKQTMYNIRKVASKQIINIFSIKNVKDYRCLLNFHNSKEELEQGEFKLSPKALEKLKYSVGFDYNKRFKQLEIIWQKEESKKMVSYYQECQIKPPTKALDSK